MCSYADICCVSFYMTSCDLTCFIVSFRLSFSSWYLFLSSPVITHFKFFKCFKLLALYSASDGNGVTSFEYPIWANSTLRLERKRLRECFHLLICLPKDFSPNARRKRKASL